MYDAILNPTIYPTDNNASDKSDAPYMRVPRTSIPAITFPSAISNPLTNQPYIAPNPNAYRITISDDPPLSPATKTSSHAIPSGYSNASSTMNTRRNAMVKIVPKTPPKIATQNTVTKFISSAKPITSNAGMVKIMPAASDSPADVIVWTALFSRIVTSLNFNKRSTNIDITAAGIDADTVIPMYKPKYVFAAVIRAPKTRPRMIARTVSSAMFFSALTYGVNAAVIVRPKQFGLSNIRSIIQKMFWSLQGPRT